MDQANLLRLALELYGEDSQIKMMIEESAELTQALCKTYRANKETVQSVRNHVLEEMADCKISLMQMENIFGSPDKWVEFKMRRLESAINGVRFEGEQP